MKLGGSNRRMRSVPCTLHTSRGDSRHLQFAPVPIRNILNVCSTDQRILATIRALESLQVTKPLDSTNYHTILTTYMRAEEKVSPVEPPKLPTHSARKKFESDTFLLKSSTNTALKF
ncbi:hypothetical protein DPMN_070192 [Dreissena polymorpha]|uniref:Uncharacterized protein n=1 Tax=Dreissena polymorpha TaxID=45954 RepID=A0A9D3Z0I6_DREPO|nr:hypothetical protein DPMN_070192 [Dreissena polymorpha]